MSPLPPLAVYIHWPFCKSKCPYCDFNSHVREQVDHGRWKAALLRELEHMAQSVPGRQVASIFFGGGTPSLMPPGIAEALIERVQALWPVAEDIEITLEANPTSVETQTFADFKRAGINRASLGVQSLRASELAFLGREHNVGEALKAIESAAKTFSRYSFDLIYARPNQTVAAWEEELTEALQYVDGHMSLYQLTIEENTAFHHAYAKGGFTLPGEEEAEALYRRTEAIMAQRGLRAYEVSNYAKPGQESRHNLSYWKGYDYIGVGPGAHGRITVGSERIATQTLKSPERWLEQVERAGYACEIWQAVERQQEAEERLMMGLRVQEGIGYDEFIAHNGYDLREYLNIAHRDLYIAKGLLVDDPTRLRTTLNGRLLLGTLTAELLA
jgi:putative oxygen-independent coproporphyrinogen III oxidase